MKRRNWILLAVLVLAMFLLSGCGVPHEGVDVLHTQPDGPWQTFVVWPLANILIGISNFLENIGIVYYWGWAIIVFTFIVKLITFPLTLQQTRGMQAQKDLQPKLQELQKKYGKDREKLAADQQKVTLLIEERQKRQSDTERELSAEGRLGDDGVSGERIGATEDDESAAQNETRSHRQRAASRSWSASASPPPPGS